MTFEIFVWRRREPQRGRVFRVRCGNITTIDRKKHAYLLPKIYVTLLPSDDLNSSPMKRTYNYETTLPRKPEPRTLLHSGHSHYWWRPNSLPAAHLLCSCRFIVLICDKFILFVFNKVINYCLSHWLVKSSTIFINSQPAVVKSFVRKLISFKEQFGNSVAALLGLKPAVVGAEFRYFTPKRN